MLAYTLFADESTVTDNIITMDNLIYYFEVF